MSKPIPKNSVFFITGCSSGMGKSLSEAIVKSPSYRLVVTARNLGALSYLSKSPNILPLALDVTSPDSIAAAVSATIERFGRIDVLINNAGYGLCGDTEAVTDEEARAQLETNFWGAVNTTKAVLPIFRETNPAGEGGVIIQVSSVGGYIGIAGNSYYHASKFALEGFTESLSREVMPEWNIRFMIFEPGGIKTEFAKGSLKTPERHPAYAREDGATSALLKYMRSEEVDKTWADAAGVAKVLVGVLEKGDIPLRLPMGSDSWGLIKDDIDHTSKELEKWKSVSCSLGLEMNEEVGFLKK